MNITLNHKPEKIPTTKTSISVEELLKIKNFTFELLIVRINDDLIKKESYPSAFIQENDNVQVIHVFGGG
jgi:sulfur carrier protein